MAGTPAHTARWKKSSSGSHNVGKVTPMLYLFPELDIAPSMRRSGCTSHSAGRRGSCQQLDLLLPGRQRRLRVEHSVQLIELLAQRGAPGFAYLYVRDGAALVIPHGEVIAVRDQVVGRLEPVGVAAGLAKAGIRAFPHCLALHEHQGITL